jgi:hypothetical protein
LLRARRAPQGADENKDLKDQARLERQLQALQEALPSLPVIVLVLPYEPRVENGSILFSTDQQKNLLVHLRRFKNWHVVDLQPSFDALLAQGTLPRGFSNTQPGVGHLNRHGHDIVGRQLAQEIEAVLP